jgi:hypothetical protein
MSTRPLVSILIPCFNAGPMLAHCLSSCLRQTYPRIEIILADNNSTDGSVKVAESFAEKFGGRFEIVPCTTQGHCHARRAAEDRAVGDFVQWLDADDELFPDKIERQVAALDNAADADVAYGDWLWRAHPTVNEGKASVTFHGAEEERDMLSALLLNRWRPPHAYLLRRSMADRARKLDAFFPDRKVGADREYFSMVALLGARFAPAPDSIVQYNRWSLQQVSHAQRLSVRARELCSVFERLRSVAGMASTPRPSHDAQWLLEQDFRLHRPLPHQRFERRSSLEFGARLLPPNESPVQSVSPLESSLLTSLQAEKGPNTLEQFAWGALNRKLARADDLRLRRTIYGLRDRGFIGLA